MLSNLINNLTTIIRDKQIQKRLDSKMEKNYKPDKHNKLQSLFLCKKQIQQLKSKLLNLIQSPCNTLQNYRKSSTPIEVNRTPNSTYQKKNKAKKNKTNTQFTLKATTSIFQPKIKKTLCPCASYWIQSDKKNKKLFKSESPKKANKSKNKANNKNLNQSKSLKKDLKIKPLRTESTAQNNIESAMRTPKQILNGPQIEPIKKTMSINYSFEDSVISSTSKNKMKGNKININHEQSLVKKFSQVKKVSNIEDKESYVSPLNSKYFKAYQQSLIMNEQKSIEQSLSQNIINHESQQAFYLDEDSPRSRIKRSRRSQNQFMSTGMTAVKNKFTSPDKRVNIERQIMTSRSRYHPIQTDLTIDRLRHICQKTERFMTEEIYPFRQVLCTTQKNTIKSHHKPSDTKLIDKISKFNLWINNQSQTNSP